MRPNLNLDELTALFVWDWQAYAYALLLALNTAFIPILWVSCGR